MLQEEQIVKLTKLKELLDAGVLNEDEFAKEKTKVMSVFPREPQTQSQPAFRESPIEQVKMAGPSDTSAIVGPANVDLSSGIVLSLGISAIIATLIGALFTGLADNMSNYDQSEAYSFSLVSGICDFLGIAAELILWICAFNKLSTMPEGKRLGRIPLWTYLYLGIGLLLGIVTIADPMADVTLVFILYLVALALGYVAYISLYKAYSGKMHTYSLVWMIGAGVSLIMGFAGADLISTILEAGVYVFLMIALLEKKEN